MLKICNHIGTEVMTRNDQYIISICYDDAKNLYFPCNEGLGSAKMILDEKRFLTSATFRLVCRLAAGKCVEYRYKRH